MEERGIADANPVSTLVAAQSGGIGSPANEATKFRRADARLNYSALDPPNAGVVAGPRTGSADSNWAGYKVT